MALFTRWFTKFRRTRPSCSRASFTIATKRAAAGEHCAASTRQRISAGSCARMSSATLRHLNHTRLLGATKVKRPKGSSLSRRVAALAVAGRRRGPGSTEASWIFLARSCGRAAAVPRHHFADGEEAGRGRRGRARDQRRDGRAQGRRRPRRGNGAAAASVLRARR